MQYDQVALKEMKQWQRNMTRRPSIMNRLSKGMQTKLNSYIPEKVHNVITTTIKQMIRGVLFGAQHITRQPTQYSSLLEADETAQRAINGYKHAAAAEGGITGAGGILLGLADFPIFLSIKLKMLFDLASIYGYSVKDYKERVFLLHIFQLTFSSQQHRRTVYAQMVNWQEQKLKLPEDIHEFDWRNFQQEYRDYIDLAKMAQLIPGIGAVVGFVVNYRLTQKLGYMAMNAYRQRWMEEGRWGN
ncbi:EcsC family protein [Flavisolibacter tropicus]|uniref:EcsC n=1 Tax=Flavisolibacter tropicus TaxID=1492898 RepID=A0A172U198_9BACT|nr:EcsC family protein [Flavisolibacter tropicus]ANE52777.1 ecsC [Flavisolibacter tropicus]